MTTLTGDRPLPSPRTALYSASFAQGTLSVVTLGLPAVGPPLRSEFGLSLPELGAVLTALLVGSGVAFLTIGASLDRYGARRTTLVGTTIATISMASAAFAPSGGVLLACLYLSGAGFGVIPIAGGAAIFEAYAPAKRAWAMGVRQMSAPLGGMVGAVLMPGLDAVGGAHAIFLFGAAIAGTSGLLLAFYSTTVRRSERQPRPLRQIARTHGIPRLLLATCFYITVLQAVLSYTVPAVRGSGFSAVTAGATYFVVNATATGSRVIFGWRADRGGGTQRRRALVDTGILAAIGAAAFGFALHADVAAILVATVVLALGASGWNAIVYTLAGELTRPELAARAFALSATVVTASTGIVTPLIGVLAAHVGWDGVWLAVVGCSLCGALLMATVPTGERRK